MHNRLVSSVASKSWINITYVQAHVHLCTSMYERTSFQVNFTSLNAAGEALAKNSELKFLKAIQALNVIFCWIAVPRTKTHFTYLNILWHVMFSFLDETWSGHPYFQPPCPWLSLWQDGESVEETKHRLVHHWDYDRCSPTHGSHQGGRSSKSTGKWKSFGEGDCHLQILIQQNNAVAQSRRGSSSIVLSVN